MYPLINIVAGSHLPVVRRLPDLLARGADTWCASQEIPPEALSNEDAANSIINMAAQKNGSCYHWISPSFFNSIPNIYRDGEIYPDLSKGASSLPVFLARENVNIHFIVEPAAHHLGRHYKSLNAEAKGYLETSGLSKSPSWFFPLMALHDTVPSVKIIAWDLTRIAEWRELFLTTLAQDVVPSEAIKQFNTNNASTAHNNFRYDSDLDMAQFELDLDCIDAVGNLALGGIP